MLNSAMTRHFGGHLGGNQWESAEYAANSTLAAIFERLYSHDALGKPPASRRLEIQAAYSHLQKWRLNLPQPFIHIHEEKAAELCLRPRLWRAAQRLIVRYYSGVFFIFCPWMCLASTSSSNSILDPEDVVYYRAQCLRAARCFVSVADRISRSNIALEG